MIRHVTFGFLISMMSSCTVLLYRCKRSMQLTETVAPVTALAAILRQRISYKMSMLTHKLLSTVSLTVDGSMTWDSS